MQAAVIDESGKCVNRIIVEDMTFTLEGMTLVQDDAQIIEIGMVKQANGAFATVTP